MSPPMTTSPLRRLRQFGLGLAVALLRLLMRPPASGWQRSTRGTSLHGR